MCTCQLHFPIPQNATVRAVTAAAHPLPSSLPPRTSTTTLHRGSPLAHPLPPGRTCAGDSGGPVVWLKEGDAGGPNTHVLVGQVRHRGAAGRAARGRVRVGGRGVARVPQQVDLLPAPGCRHSARPACSAAPPLPQPRSRGSRTIPYHQPLPPSPTTSRHSRGLLLLPPCLGLLASPH